MNVFWFTVGFGLSGVFRPPAVLGSRSGQLNLCC